MPGRPRYQVIDDNQVGLYHVWTRCVRRARLCGYDPLTGKDYGYRRKWIYKRLQHLTEIFGIDACVYAIMPNHYHLMVRNRPDLVRQWSDEEVARRWWRLHPLRRDENGKPAAPTELELRMMLAKPKKIAAYRKRLRSISWFMKSLNEWMARRANLDDDNSGHFWQARFGCRRLLDEGAVLACALYIDLNEIRAELAASPETSQHTSAYRRIQAKLRQCERQAAKEAASEGRETHQSSDPDYWLCPLSEQDSAPLLGPRGAESVEASRTCQVTDANRASVNKQWRHGFLSMQVTEYLELLDWHARKIAPGKRGAMDARLPPILTRLGLAPDFWLQLVENFDSWFCSAAGSATRLRDEAARQGRQWLMGVGQWRKAYD